MWANTTDKNQGLIQPPIKITEVFKNIPHNPDSIGENEINKFAWKVFVALNWPVDCQGKALSSQEGSWWKRLSKIIGQAPEAPRAWELYPSPQSVFLPNGRKPISLNRLPEVSQCLNDLHGSEIEYNQDLRLTETGQLVGQEQLYTVEIANRKDLLDGYGELKDSNLLYAVDAANRFPLVDRQGNYVINEIRINPVEFRQIVKNKWYDATQLASIANSNKPFRIVCSTGLKPDIAKNYCDRYEAEGAIEIKAAWRVFDRRNTQEEKARYYITKRKIVDNTGKVLDEEAELGLIGFHIMHKTSQVGWVWSTFEHIDNAPSCASEVMRQYTLHDKKCNTGNCRENWPNVKPPYLWRTTNDRPKAIEGTEIKDQIPSQICRSNPVSRSAQKQNEVWQNAFRQVDKSSVWQYYRLIGTEWLQHPQIPYSHKTGQRRKITPLKRFLINVALEPYAQGVSCIVCHTSAHLPGLGNSCELSVKDNVNDREDSQKICRIDKTQSCADFSFLMKKAQFSQISAFLTN
ncbi:MAG: hypothetical protein SAL07_01415 [Oscillatoria sp. PMC 1051.18]|nr:hypothetical protein [Oscillatoria sp. PMC 1050.18]MEC5028542.1 hypothetical protein [Oscillatoria sp. PMC 1051.18]